MLLLVIETGVAPAPLATARPRLVDFHSGPATLGGCGWGWRRHWQCRGRVKPRKGVSFVRGEAGGAFAVCRKQLLVPHNHVARGSKAIGTLAVCCRSILHICVAWGSEAERALAVARKVLHKHVTCGSKAIRAVAVHDRVSHARGGAVTLTFSAAT